LGWSNQGMQFRRRYPAFRVGWSCASMRNAHLAAAFAGVLALWLAGPETAWALQAGCGEAGDTVTCVYSTQGQTASFTVPAQITSLEVQAVGGTGAGSTMGGSGAFVSETVAVTPAWVLNVQVAGNANGASGGAGGGGSGGSSTPSNGAPCAGYGGGGASWITHASTDLIVAGGGGGNGCGGNDGFGDLGPESPGGNAGSAGQPASASDAGGGGDADPGTGAGGAGGQGGTVSPSDSGANGSSGTAGGPFAGGPGGASGDDSFDPACSGAGPVGGGGGGGGGGYGGGGGGGGGAAYSTPASGCPDAPGGGGGGGSNWVPARGSSTTDTTHTPQVAISYMVTGLPTATIDSPASGRTYDLDQPVSTTFSCADAPFAPGIASCVDSTGHDAPTGALDTSTAGPHTYTVTATSMDGTMQSASISYTVIIPPPRATISGVSKSGATASLTVVCDGFPWQRCLDTVTATTTARERDGSVFAVSARNHHRRHKHQKVVSVTVATAQFTVSAGHSTIVRLTVNRTGKQLLTRFYSLPTRLSFTGAPVAAQKITFSYPLVTGPPNSSWATWQWLSQPCRFCWTRVDASFFFGVPQLPKTAKVNAHCYGGGCPPPRSFGPHRHSVDLRRMFAGRKLGAGTTIQLRITAPNSVGRVITYTMQAGNRPHTTDRCLPPGATKPLTCAISS
jgi:hypothetical protein